MPVEVRPAAIDCELKLDGACPISCEPRSGLPADGPLRHPDNNEPTTTKPAKAYTGFVPIGIPPPLTQVSRRTGTRADRAPGKPTSRMTSVEPPEKWGDSSERPPARQ